MSNELLLAPKEKSNKFHLTIDTVEDEDDTKHEQQPHHLRRKRSRTASNPKNQIRTVSSKECYVCTK